MDIRTKRLRLRRAVMDDLVPMFEIMSNPSAMRYWSTLPHADLDVTRVWLERMIARNLNGSRQLLIEMDGRVIGEVGSGEGVAPEFGFMVHPAFWGQGIATEASIAFIDCVFAEETITHLHADVDPRNAASLSVLGRLGFVETGRASKTFLLGDEWSDSIYLQLKRPS